MATEMITLKLDDKFLKDIDKVVKKQNYQSRTEFIRNSLREKLNKIKIQEAILEFNQLKGKSKSKTSNAQYERIRKKAFESLK